MVAFNQFYLTLKRFLKPLALRQFAMRTVCLLIVTVIAIGSVWSPTAMAVGSQEAADVVNDRAAAELDRISGPGTSDKLEGTVQETVGKAKRGAANLTDGFDNSLGNKLDSAANKLDGATDEVAGKVKRDVGKAKGAAANAADDVEETSKGFVESVKDFFN